MLLRLRVELHKHAREGLLCLLESCTAEEYDRVRARGLQSGAVQVVASPVPGHAAAPAGSCAANKRVHGGCSGRGCGKWCSGRIGGWASTTAAAATRCRTTPRPPAHPCPNWQVLLALGGRRRIVRRLRGRLPMPCSYVRRMEDVEATHKALGAGQLAYQNPALKYAALPGALLAIPLGCLPARRAGAAASHAWRRA